jgi:TatD DNase family protein
MFDSHCHLTDGRFAGDLDDVLRRSWEAGVSGIVTVASDIDDALAAMQIARTDARIHATAGVHPHVADGAGSDTAARLRDILDDDRVVAIGETGLDFHYDNSARPAQRRLFEIQLQLAAELQYPVVVHSRAADADTAAMIRGAGVTGVLHCFSGSADLLAAALEVDWYVSFAGLITFRNFTGADLLRAVPAERLLLETDSPYLAPVPHRGRRNEPAFVAATCAAAAALLEEPPAAVAQRTAANARRFYRIAAPGSGGAISR